MRGMKRSFSAEGLNIDRFVRRLGEADIPIEQMRKSGRKIYAVAREDQLDAVRELAEQGGWRFSTGRKWGIGRYVELGEKRKALLAGVFVCIVLVSVALQLVWQVEVSGKGIYQRDAERFLNEIGVRAFIWKHDVNLSELQQTLEWRYPDIAWVNCAWRGTTLRVELVEGVTSGNATATNGMGDVVAARGGVINSIITLAGTPMVQPGDIVQPGQLLIEGKERIEGEQYVPVMARGKVMARVWDQASIRMTMKEVATSYTGEVQEQWVVHCPWFPLWRSVSPVDKQADAARSTCELGGLFFPFVLQKNMYWTAETNIRMRSLPEIKAEAGAAALRRLKEKIGIHDELVDKWVDYCMIEDEVLCAVATGERLIDIAESRRSVQ